MSRRDLSGKVSHARISTSTFQVCAMSPRRSAVSQSVVRRGECHFMHICRRAPTLRLSSSCSATFGFLSRDPPPKKLPDEPPSSQETGGGGGWRRVWRVETETERKRKLSLFLPNCPRVTLLIPPSATRYGASLQAASSVLPGETHEKAMKGLV